MNLKAVLHHSSYRSKLANFKAQKIFSIKKTYLKVHLHKRCGSGVFTEQCDFNRIFSNRHRWRQWQHLMFCRLCKHYFKDHLHWRHLLLKPSATATHDSTSLGHLGWYDDQGKHMQHNIAGRITRDITLNIANVNSALERFSTQCKYS